MKVERPDTAAARRQHLAMMKDENWSELVQGDHSRSGGQWDIWEATYGPVGADGYPQRIWDKKTGVIDKKVADVLEGALRPAQHPRDELGDARAEGREQDQRLRRRRRFVFPQHGRAHARELSQDDRRSEVDGRDRLSADGAALLGPARIGADRRRWSRRSTKNAPAGADLKGWRY